MLDGVIRIFLADDHHLVRNGITSLLENVKGIYLSGEASNGRELITRYFECKPDVVIADISMPIMTGIEAAEKILARDKNAKILFLSVNDSEEYIYQALKIGVLGLVNKTIAKGDLILAIETVFNGQRYFGNSYTEEKITEILEKYNKNKKAITSNDVKLKYNEIETLRMICKGMSSAEIAKKLCLSKKTIDGYRSNLMEKCGVSNTIQLIWYVVENKLLE